MPGMYFNCLLCGILMMSQVKAVQVQHFEGWYKMWGGTAGLLMVKMLGGTAVVNVKLD